MANDLVATVSFCFYHPAWMVNVFIKSRMVIKCVLSWGVGLFLYITKANTIEANTAPLPTAIRDAAKRARASDVDGISKYMPKGNAITEMIVSIISIFSFINLSIVARLWHFFLNKRSIASSSLSSSSEESSWVWWCSPDLSYRLRYCYLLAWLSSLYIKGLW